MSRRRHREPVPIPAEVKANGGDIVVLQDPDEDDAADEQTEFEMPDEPVPVQRDRKWLVFGAGSPEQSYLGTRFNIGAAVIDVLAELNDVQMRETGAVWFGIAERPSGIVSLAKPNIMPEMINDSLFLLKRADACDHRCAVLLYGDRAFPAGEVKIKSKGGDPGNKVVDGFVRVFGKRDVVRVRIGLGPKPNEPHGRPSEFEQDTLPRIMRGIHVAAQVVHELVEKGQFAASELATLANRGKALV